MSTIHSLRLASTEDLWVINDNSIAKKFPQTLKMREVELEVDKVTSKRREIHKIISEHNGIGYEKIGEEVGLKGNTVNEHCKILEKLGFVSVFEDDNTHLVFMKEKLPTEGLDIGTRPKEGDLIYFGLTSKLFQIMFVEHELPFYQVGTLPTFDLTCELFTYSDEALDTGIDTIDKIERQQSFVRTFELSGTSGTFTVGETVTGGTSAVTGEVARWDSATSYLYLINMTGTFTLTEIITGATSLATGTYATKITTDETTETLQTIDDSTSDKVSSTKQFEIDADSVFDFSETNPFGDNP